MSDAANTQGQAKVEPKAAKPRLVVATRRGYWGTQIKDPEGSAKEREPFLVPADAKASWFVDAPKAAKAQEADIG